jgi:hypothetical protein
LLQPFFDGIHQAHLGEGLAEVIVHAGVQAALAITLDGAGREGDDGVRGRPWACSMARISAVAW